MKKAFFAFLAIPIVCLSLAAQDKYGLVLDNKKIIRPQDTISLSYPSGMAIIVCELFDANNTVLGQAGAAWSMSGNLTIIDTPLVAPKIIIMASNALTDQRGYISAGALESGAQWISNKVFVKIKGKNSGVLRTLAPHRTQSIVFGKFDSAGRMLAADALCPSGVVLMRGAPETIHRRAIIIK